MKKIYIIIIIIISLYGCNAREVIVPVEIKLARIENTEIINNVSINLKILPLYEKNIKYNGKLPLTDYLFTNSNANIRNKPSIDGRILGQTKIFKKIEVLEKIKGDNIKNNNIWYKVHYDNYIGYIHSSVVVKRKFRFEEMARKARKLDLFIKKSKNNNWDIEKIVQYNPGSSEDEDAPVDIYGHRGEQSIRSIYTSPSGENILRYLSDGRIVSIKKSEQLENIITIPDSLKTYKIELGKTKKIDVDNGINKIIVIDLDNQNQGIFLKKENVWQLISYSLIITGRNDNRDSYETPKGYFLVGNTVKQVIFVSEKKVKKQDLNTEVTKNIKGKEISREDNNNYEIVKKYSRANYGIRFSGGGYIHGIPLSDDIVKELGSEKAVKERKKRATISLGTYKRSHKCVRSSEEHESFLYHDFVGYDPEYEGKWWRLPKENVAVIVF